MFLLLALVAMAGVYLVLQQQGDASQNLGLDTGSSSSDGGNVGAGVGVAGLAGDPSQTPGERAVLDAAIGAEGTAYHPGQSEQCGNFVCSLFHRAGLDAPSNPGLAESWAHIGTPVPVGSQQPGDVLLFANTYGNWPQGTITHVGVYTGEGNMVDRGGSNASNIQPRPIGAVGGRLIGVRRP